RIVLRKNDYIKGTGKELNALGDKISDFAMAMQNDLKQMDSLMEKPEEISILKEQLGKIKSTLSLLANQGDK
ncbi:MAG: hypothetical protein GY707_19225, partial [Desulfobacteraceae bacterium]|nr:hypothetical protein [Desulfobacteraceae bacterium]